METNLIIICILGLLALFPAIFLLVFICIFLWRVFIRFPYNNIKYIVQYLYPNSKKISPGKGIFSFSRLANGIDPFNNLPMVFINNDSEGITYDYEMLFIPKYSSNAHHEMIPEKIDTTKSYHIGRDKLLHYDPYLLCFMDPDLLMDGNEKIIIEEGVPAVNQNNRNNQKTADSIVFPIRFSYEITSYPLFYQYYVGESTNNGKINLNRDELNSFVWSKIKYLVRQTIVKEILDRRIKPGDFEGKNEFEGYNDMAGVDLVDIWDRCVESSASTENVQDNDYMLNVHIRPIIKAYKNIPEFIIICGCNIGTPKKVTDQPTSSEYDIFSEADMIDTIPDIPDMF